MGKISSPYTVIFENRIACHFFGRISPVTHEQTAGFLGYDDCIAACLFPLGVLYGQDFIHSPANVVAVENFHARNLPSNTDIIVQN